MKGRALLVLGLSVLLRAGSLSGSPKESPQTVSFITLDGVSIVGTWYPPPRSPAPAVLLLHMFGGERGDWEGFAPRLQEAGYGALAIDLRGHGESRRQGGQFLDYRQMGENEFKDILYDVEAAWDFLEACPSVDSRRIGIIGAELGANQALRFAAQKVDVKTLVLLSPRWEYRGVGVEREVLRYGERPMFIAASLDDAPSASASRRLEGIAKGKRKLKLYERAGIGIQMLSKVPDLSALILDWLKETLG